MKKLIVLFSVLITLSSCNVTTGREDTQMLQSKYQTVYQVDLFNYVTIDSIGIYHITVTRDGQIRTKIKIK
jgi:hypothetical protein